MNDYKDRLYNLDNSTLFEYKCYYKTNMCKYKTECKHKDTCYFAHYSDEIKKPICMNYFNHNSCSDPTCVRLHTNVTPFLPDFLVNILLDIIREKRDRTREKIRERKRRRSVSPVNEGGRERSSLQRSVSPINDRTSERSSERSSLQRSVSPVRGDDRPLKRYQTAYETNYKLVEKEEELHKYYQNQVNEIHQSYQYEMNKINAQVVSQITLLKQIIDAKDNELIILKTNIQTILNKVFQQQPQHQPQQSIHQQSIHQQPFSPAMQQKIKQEEINKSTYAANILHALKQYSDQNIKNNTNSNTANGKPNAPSI